MSLSHIHTEKQHYYKVLYQATKIKVYSKSVIKKNIRSKNKFYCLATGKIYSSDKYLNLLQTLLCM